MQQIEIFQWLNCFAVAFIILLLLIIHFYMKALRKKQADWAELTCKHHTLLNAVQLSVEWLKRDEFIDENAKEKCHFRCGWQAKIRSKVIARLEARIKDSEEY